METPSKNLFFLLILLNTPSGYLFKSSKRSSSSSIYLVVHDKHLCYHDLNEKYMLRTPEKDMCSYKGKNYTFAEHIFDPDTCRSCMCLAPENIFCCQALLTPEQMPDTCEVAPNWRHSTVPPLGKCLTPIVEKKPLGRGHESCRNRKLRRSLSGTRLQLSGRNRAGYVRIAALKSIHTNSKRSSGDRKTADISSILKRLFENTQFKIDISSLK